MPCTHKFLDIVVKQFQHSVHAAPTRGGDAGVAVTALSRTQPDPSSTSAGAPFIAADVGGTHVRIGLVRGDGRQVSAGVRQVRLCRPSGLAK